MTTPVAVFRTLTLLLLPGLACADEVACHATDGGAEQVLVARPVVSPYTVPVVQIGSYFQFRVVFQKAPRDLASIKVYTYADNDEGSVPLHQASYPYPPKAQGRHGFTGMHYVYEPVRDGELQYWCELRP
jgi:hypothetical protein